MKINSKISLFAGIVTLIFITQIIIIVYLIMFDLRIARFLGFGALFILVTILIYNLIMKYVVFVTKDEEDDKKVKTSEESNKLNENNEVNSKPTKILYDVDKGITDRQIG